jgi:hypothetical protein
MIKKEDCNIMQTKELIDPGGATGYSQAYGVLHYLDDSLLDDYSFLVKKLHHLYSRVDDIRGHTNNMCAVKKTPNEIWCKVSREYIKLPTFKKYQKTQKESS